LVRARDLRKAFPGHVAVEGISFDIHEGEIVGFLGPNGAGKTTTIRMLLNVLTPTSGELTLFGDTFDKARSRILSRLNSSSGTLTLPG
jgi:ABC-2 type transport system ATP-binding protein